MDEDGRKKNYYKIRDLYNSEMHGFDFENYNNEWIERTAYLIFMNKTCFNGLFRQNKKGEFNVPFGLYKNPRICDETNIKLVNRALKDTEIICSDFTDSESHINERTFVYLDPPYRPLQKHLTLQTTLKMGSMILIRSSWLHFLKKWINWVHILCSAIQTRKMKIIKMNFLINFTQDTILTGFQQREI